VPDLWTEKHGYKRKEEKGVKRNQLTIVAGARHVVSRTGFVTSELVHSLGKGSFGLAELDHTRLEVVKWPFYEAGLFLVMSQEIVPQRMLESM